MKNTRLEGGTTLVKKKIKTKTKHMFSYAIKKKTKKKAAKNKINQPKENE